MMLTGEEHSIPRCVKFRKRTGPTVAEEGSPASRTFPCSSTAASVLVIDDALRAVCKPEPASRTRGPVNFFKIEKVALIEEAYLPEKVAANQHGSARNVSEFLFHRCARRHLFPL